MCWRRELGVRSLGGLDGVVGPRNVGAVCVSWPPAKQCQVPHLLPTRVCVAARNHYDQNSAGRLEPRPVRAGRDLGVSNPALTLSSVRTPVR